MIEKKLCLVPDKDSMISVQTMVSQCLEQGLIPPKIARKINIVVDEIYSNIIAYSHAGLAEVVCKVERESVLLIFTDNGIPYNPLEAREPDVHASLEERKIGGLGIFLSKKLMDQISYEYKDGNNCLSLIKNKRRSH